VIVHNFHPIRISVLPFEANTPLVINSDTPLPAPPTLELFQPVGWRNSQVSNVLRAIEHSELSYCSLLNLYREFPRLFEIENTRCFLAVKRPYHLSIIDHLTFNVKWNKEGQPNHQADRTRGPVSFVVIVNSVRSLAVFVTVILAKVISMRAVHIETHRAHRINWLRAAVLGANDGIVSVSSLVVGVAAGGATQSVILLTGIAGLVAGALSMAAGEYISVQSQADTENADLTRERRELAEEPEQELEELKAIYIKRGLDEELARQVAQKLMANDALAAHARDELGITEELSARPIQASLASAAAFSVGAVVPILSALFAPAQSVSYITTITTLLTLTLLGSLAAYAGGASIVRGALRVTFWGALALAVTAGVGKVIGISL
jgi:vacuolar iron transporter family protein